jgi:hypothetical protein
VGAIALGLSEELEMRLRLAIAFFTSGEREASQLALHGVAAKNEAATAAALRALSRSLCAASVSCPSAALPPK